MTCSTTTCSMPSVALFPGSPGMRICMYVSLYVIKIVQKQKGNVLRVVQLTMLQSLVCMIFNAR